MKLLSIVGLILLYSFTAWSQEIYEAEDGSYYDSKGKLYSGVYTEYYKDDILKTEMTLLKGLKNGPTRIYFPNGTIQELRSYKKGKMHGTWITWDQKKVKIGEANYKNGRKDGGWMIWDENGTLRYDMTYRKGEKTGTWIIYNEKGELVDKKVYK